MKNLILLLGMFLSLHSVAQDGPGNSSCNTSEVASLAASAYAEEAGASSLKIESAQMGDGKTTSMAFSYQDSRGVDYLGKVLVDEKACKVISISSSWAEKIILL